MTRSVTFSAVPAIVTRLPKKGSGRVRRPSVGTDRAEKTPREAGWAVASPILSPESVCRSNQPGPFSIVQSELAEISSRALSGGVIGQLIRLSGRLSLLYPLLNPANDPEEVVKS